VKALEKDESKDEIGRERILRVILLREKVVATREDRGYVKKRESESRHSKCVASNLINELLATRISLRESVLAERPQLEKQEEGFY
jgi:hypothetical protein